jgi:hypothetical protein
VKLDYFLEIKKRPGAALTGAPPFLERPTAPPPQEKKPSAEPRTLPKQTAKK